jgi:hypothetical protein
MEAANVSETLQLPCDTTRSQPLPKDVRHFLRGSSGLVIPGTSVPFRIKGRRFGSSLTRAEVPQDADETMASEILSLGGGGRTGRLWENHDSELYSSGYNQQETRVYGDDGANIIGKRRQSAASTRHTTASSVNLRCRGKRGDYTRTSCLAPGTSLGLWQWGNRFHDTRHSRI